MLVRKGEQPSNIADRPSQGDDDLKGLGERMHLDITNLISEATMPILQGDKKGQVA